MATNFKYTSTNLIGNVKKRFEQLKHRGIDYRSFYLGWIEGRVDAIKQDKSFKPINKDPIQSHISTFCGNKLNK